MPVMMKNELTQTAMGGTELMCLALQKYVSKNLLDKVQIWPSRYRPEKVMHSLPQILWCHDLPGDPENDHLKNGGYNKFERIVFVSNWQMQQFIAMYGIPWHKCIVIENAIESPKALNIEQKPKPTNIINLVYHTTPHRGLEILIPAFKNICKTLPDNKLHLTVFSSFKIYGWKQRDEPYKQLFEEIKNHPNMTYRGTVPNKDIREFLYNEAHIYTYPCKWQETSCISMIEALEAGCSAIHSNLAALPETTARHTNMYQYDSDMRDHLAIFQKRLLSHLHGFDLMTQDQHSDYIEQNKLYYSQFYWEYRVRDWEGFLQEVVE